MQLDKILNIIYPKHCPLCHNILLDQNALVCSECIATIQPIRSPFCMKCGRPVEQEQEYCTDCAGRSRSFTEGRGIFLYDKMWKNSMMHYKYFGCREYSRFYGKALAVYAKEEIKRWNPDVIVPVPIHSQKRRSRGFNQAELLAEQFGRYTNIPVDNSLVKKLKTTKSQKKLSAEERKQNLLKAFYVERQLNGQNILVIDDVFTTGSTMDTMAEMLKNSGAHNVYFLTLCIGLI